MPGQTRLCDYLRSGWESEHSLSSGRVAEGLVASAILLDVSEWLEVELTGQGVEPRSRQQIQRPCSRVHFGESWMDGVQNPMKL